MDCCDFKKQFTLEKRKLECKRILQRYPDRVPVIATSQSPLRSMIRFKFLSPADLSLGQFVPNLRKQVDVKPEEALFIFVNNTSPPMSALMGQIYKSHKDEDGFLYITITSENAFGNLILIDVK